jgi:hypothetical protein
MELKRKELGVEAKKAGAKGESPPQSKEGNSGSVAARESGRTRPERDEATLAPSEAEVKDAPANEGSTARAWLWFVKMRRFCLPAAGFLLVVAFLFIGIKFKDAVISANPSPRLEPVTSIMRPIPTPDYRDMLDFLLLYELHSQKMLTAIRMEVAFQSPTRYQNFKDRNVAFRDTVYAFLIQQNLQGNTLQSWHSVIEKDLADYLKVKLPQSYADAIKLAQVENL